VLCHCEPAVDGRVAEEGRRNRGIEGKWEREMKEEEDEERGNGDFRSAGRGAVVAVVVVKAGGGGGEREALSTGVVVQSICIPTIDLLDSTIASDLLRKATLLARPLGTCMALDQWHCSVRSTPYCSIYPARSCPFRMSKKSS
jgi:hypothetical protein